MLFYSSIRLAPIYITPKNKTIFTIESEEDKKKLGYRSLAASARLKLRVSFNYSQDGTTKQGQIEFVIPEDKTDEEIKDLILAEIEKITG